MTGIVFHLCVVDVLIKRVRFSFWRQHGVLHADSGGGTVRAGRAASISSAHPKNEQGAKVWCGLGITHTFAVYVTYITNVPLDSWNEKKLTEITKFCGVLWGKYIR